MRLLHRAPRLPEPVRRALDPRGQVLAIAPLAGGWAVATTHGLHTDVDGDIRYRDWTTIGTARLDPHTQELMVTWVDGSASTSLPLGEGSRRFARAVHDRVQSSVVHGEHVAVGRGRTVHVVLRRAASGALFTQVIGDGTVDLDDPAVAGPVDAAEARVREAAGL